MPSLMQPSTKHLANVKDLAPAVCEESFAAQETASRLKQGLRHAHLPSGKCLNSMATSTLVQNAFSVSCTRAAMG